MNAQRVAVSSNPRFTSSDVPVTMSPDKSRIARLLFLGSLYFVLTDIRQPTRMELKDVNSRFNLACTDGALLLPAALSKWFWKGCDIKSILTRYHEGGTQMNRLCLEIMGTRPQWMRYADSVRMQRDIQAVFDSIPRQ